MKFSLKIQGKHLNEEQIWTSVGTDKKGNTIVANTANYAKDATLTINNELKVVGGYEFVFNSGNSITVSALE